MKKQISATYLCAKYLEENGGGQICHMKKVCKCNNVAQRVMKLRQTYKWDIITKELPPKGRTRIFIYKLKKSGTMPRKFI